MKTMIFALMLFCAFVPSADASQIDAIMSEGQKAYVNGDYQKAGACFDRAVLDAPERFDVFLYSAKALAGKGHFSLALVDVDESIRLNPDNTESFCVKSYILQAMGEEKTALDNINGLLLKHPQNAAVYYVRAIVNEEMDQLDAAIDDYTKALKFKGKTFSKKKDEIVLNLPQMPALDRKCAAIYFGRAMAYSKNGDFKKAKKDFKKAIEIEPSLIRNIPEGVLEED